MSTQPQSDRDQITYRTYDNRAVTRSTIERAFARAESRARWHARRQTARTFLLAAVMVAVLLAAFAILVWRLATIV